MVGEGDLTLNDLVKVIVVVTVTQGISNVPAISATKNLRSELKVLNDRLYGIANNVSNFSYRLSILEKRLDKAPEKGRQQIPGN